MSTFLFPRLIGSSTRLTSPSVVPGCGGITVRRRSCQLRGIRKYTGGSAVSNRSSKVLFRFVQSCKMGSEAVAADVEQEHDPKTESAGLQSGNVAPENQMPTSLAERWVEIHGRNDWNGLLKPLDETLRAEIIRIGEFAQSCYDNFDCDPHSKYCGSSLWNRATMFEKCGLRDRGYEVERYIYATANISVPFFLRTSDREDSWDDVSNWMGYIAVCKDDKEIKRLGRREIVIAWRGSIQAIEWAANLKDHLVPAALIPDHDHLKKLDVNVTVERGFWDLYTSSKESSKYNPSPYSARLYMKEKLVELLERYANEEVSITITGHSLGAALAVLSAWDIAECGWNRRSGPHGDARISVFSFAGPRVGNSPFKDRVDKLGVKVLRMVNVNDIVPRIPGVFVNENLPLLDKLLDKLPWTYSHVGVELKLNDKDSPYLDETKAEAGTRHNLEQYLHLVAILGRKKQPPLRDVALVNKRCDFLLKTLFIPPLWWQEKNKGLRVLPTGLYGQPDRKPEDVPSPTLNPSTVNP